MEVRDACFVGEQRPAATPLTRLSTPIITDLPRNDLVSPLEPVVPAAALIDIVTERA